MIPTLTLIGPGGGQQQAQCDGHPPRAEHGDGEEAGGARLHRLQVSTVQYSTVQYRIQVISLSSSLVTVFTLASYLSLSSFSSPL